MVSIGICKTAMGWMSTLYKRLLAVIILLSSSRSVLMGLAGWIHDSLCNEQCGFLLACVFRGIFICIFSSGLKVAKFENSQLIRTITRNNFMKETRGFLLVSLNKET